MDTEFVLKKMKIYFVIGTFFQTKKRGDRPLETTQREKGTGRQFGSL